MSTCFSKPERIFDARVEPNCTFCRKISSKVAPLHQSHTMTISDSLPHQISRSSLCTCPHEEYLAWPGFRIFSQEQASLGVSPSTANVLRLDYYSVSSESAYVELHGYRLFSSKLALAIPISKGYSRTLVFVYPDPS
jgi:hypothetical protein